MKTTFLSRAKQTFFIAGTLLLGLGVFSSCDNDDDDDLDNRPYTVTGNATSAQMVPAGTATGTGTFTGTYNPANRQMTYTTGWTGLTGAPTGGGFYIGASGVSGTAFGDPWAFDGSATGTGTRTGTITLTEAQWSQLSSGSMYYSYNTGANTSGEIRGQLTATR